MTSLPVRWTAVSLPLAPRLDIGTNQETLSQAVAGLTTQRKPMCEVEVSIGCAWRAAGR
jgi:hypothetical protein